MAAAPILKKHPVIAGLLFIPVLLLVTLGYAIGLVAAPLLSGIVAGWNEARKAWDFHDLETPDDD